MLRAPVLQYVKSMPLLYPLLLLACVLLNRCLVVFTQFYSYVVHRNRNGDRLEAESRRGTSWARAARAAAIFAVAAAVVSSCCFCYQFVSCCCFVQEACPHVCKLLLLRSLHLTRTALGRVAPLRTYLFFFSSYYLWPSFLPPPSRNSDPGSCSRLFPPPRYGWCLAFLSRENLSTFFPPRRLASNCAYPRQALLAVVPFIFLQVYSKSQHGGIRTQKPT